MQERRKKIESYIEKNGEASIADLIKLFDDVSEMTIRRDLEHLEKKGAVIRVKGGAKSVKIFSGPVEAAYNSRSVLNLDLKSEIAKKAVSLVKGRECIYLDVGTTAMKVAELLSGREVFVLTGGPNIAMKLLTNEKSTVNILGGELDGENFSITGQSALDFIDSINIELAFVAASGFQKSTGFTCGREAESLIKKKVIQKARKCAIIMDSSKDSVSLPYTFSRAEDIDIFISDSGISEDTRKYLESKKVEIL